MRSPISASLQARGTLAARARYAVANNPLAAAGVSALVTQTIGAGIKPSSLHNSTGIKASLNSAFSDWVDVADADGRTDWFGIQAALFRSMAVAGEGLALMLNTEAGLRIRVLDPEQLDASYTVQLEGGARLVPLSTDETAVAHFLKYLRSAAPLGRMSFRSSRTIVRTWITISAISPT
jgi:capsid protein